MLNNRSKLDAEAKDVTEYFCRHLIGLCWYEGQVNDKGEFTRRPDFRCASGFLLQVHHTVRLVTAAHVLSEYMSRNEKKGTVGKQHSLFDLWSPRSTCKERIPFDFTQSPSFVEDSPQHGLDFASIELPDSILQMFSHTIEPITSDRSLHQTTDTFDFFALLGIPAIDAVQDLEGDARRNSITTFPNPRLVFIDACSNPPPETQTTTHPQFVGRIRPNETIADIAGTSGGLIFGFRRNEHDQLQYWPVAIQSRWRRDARIVIGTSFPVVVGCIQNWVAACASIGNDTRRR